MKTVDNRTKQYGETIYGTRGNVMPPQDRGTFTGKGNKLFVHILKPTSRNCIFLPGIVAKTRKAAHFDDSPKIQFMQYDEGLLIYPGGINADSIDTIIALE